MFRAAAFATILLVALLGTAEARGPSQLPEPELGTATGKIDTGMGMPVDVVVEFWNVGAQGEGSQYAEATLTTAVTGVPMKAHFSGGPNGVLTFPDDPNSKLTLAGGKVFTGTFQGFDAQFEVEDPTIFNDWPEDEDGDTGASEEDPLKDVPARYKDDMWYCLCDLAGKEQGWECNVMGGPRCYYDPQPGGVSEQCGGSGPCRFEGFGCGRGSPSAKNREECFKQTVLKPLCAEAVERFGLPEKAAKEPSHLRIDENAFANDIWEAIGMYNSLSKAAGSEEEAYVQENAGGTIPALTWLFNYEGMADAVSKRFVFLQDEDREKSVNKAPAGTEPALWDAIDQYWKDNNKQPLSPKEVFLLALNQRKGNVREALLLVHNVLRSLGREGSNALTNVPYSPTVFNTHFEALRAPTGDKDPASASDSSGLWYHYFGMAYFEVQTQGDQTILGLVSAVPLVGSPLASAARETSKKLEQLLNYIDSGKKDVRSDEAALINEMEQLIRQYGQREQSQDPDPEKYCVNLWAADLGTALYNELPTKDVNWRDTAGAFATGSVEGARDLATTMKDLASKFWSKTKSTAKEAADGAWNWLTTPLSEETQREISGHHRIVIEGSPADITWQDAEGNDLMLFHQATESVYGFYGVPLFPFYEEWNETWGMAWVSPVDEAHKVVLTATDDAPVHLIVIDPETGEVAQYSPELTTDQTVTFDFTEGQVEPAATMEDGTMLEPERHKLDAEGGEVTASSEAGDGLSFTSPLVLAGIAGALVVLAVAVFVMRRPRPRPVAVGATMAAPSPVPQAPPAVAEQPQAMGGEVCACGAVLAAGARFCRQCGTPFTPSTPRCPTCGAEVAADWRFCKSCGGGL